LDAYQRQGLTRRVVKIPNAIQVERYDPDIDTAAVRRSLGIVPGAPVVAMAGRLSPFKGQADLIRAAATILKVRPDTSFLIAGHDTTEGTLIHGPNATSYRSILDDLITELGVGDRVRLIGYVADLPALMASADVVAMPSWEEPFGLVALEGMAMAKPVVATHAGGVPEFIDHGATGLLIPPRDPAALAAAVLELLIDPRRAKTMGQRARWAVGERHSARVYATSVTRVLQEAAGVRHM
jgi:glycosyltransferase involved in cell wall biosynthesis